MATELSGVLRKKAEAEIYVDLNKAFGGTPAQQEERASSLREQAEGILQERIRDVLKMHERREKQLSEVATKSNIGALRDGFRKDLRFVLRTKPGGMSKETADEVLEELIPRSK